MTLTARASLSCFSLPSHLSFVCFDQGTSDRPLSFSNKMKGTGILAVAVLAGSALGKPFAHHAKRNDFAIKDTHHVPRRWKQVGYPEADHKIALRIGLKQSSFDELERHLCE